MKTENAVEDGAGGARLVTSLVRLHQALQEVALPLDLPGSQDVRDARDAMVDQLQDYVIPRVMTIEAPLLAVVGGSTGAGKSTLVNSLVGTKVTTSGVLRPTTRSPVLVHHPDDAGWFGQDRLLPDLRRVEEGTDDHDAVQLVASDRLLPGLAILDAPDVDSVEEENRHLAAELLASADLWLFVTSAARYSDQVPWDYLRKAADRSAAVAVVLDRTPADAVETVSTHLARMMASRGLKDSPLFTVDEGEVSDDGLLPADHVADIRAWLDMLAEDADARQAVVTQTLDGTVRGLSLDVHRIAEAGDQQAEAARRLRADVELAYDEARREVTYALSGGTTLRGEVLARWQEYIGTGERSRSTDSTVGRLRQRLLGAIRGLPQQAEGVAEAVKTGLELLVLDEAEGAAERVARAWALSDARGRLDRPSVGLRGRVDRALREWQEDVYAAVREQDKDPRGSATYLAHGPNGLAVALMIVMLAGSSEGAEGGRRLLETVFDADATDGMVRRARTGLDERVTALLDAEQARHAAVVEELGIDPAAPAKVRNAARELVDARFAGRL